MNLDLPSMVTQKKLPLDIPLPFNERDYDFDSSLGPNEQIPRTICECRMLDLSWTLRQKPNWYEKIKDPVLLDKWKKEALDQQVDVVQEWRLTHNMVDYVLKELDNYAKLRDVETGIEHACDDAVFWSQSLISQDFKLTSALREEVAKLENVPDDKKDWHPNSNNQVLDLVHPSLYPIVYGRTYVGDLTDPKKTEIIQPPERQDLMLFRSTKFCWLPSDFYVSGDGTVKLTSPYINNIHPSSTTLINTITSIISRFVPMWERVLGSVDLQDRPTGGGVSGKSVPTAHRLHGAGENCIWPDGDAGDKRIYNKDGDESEYEVWPGESEEDKPERINWLRSKIFPRHGDEEGAGAASTPPSITNPEDNSKDIDDQDAVHPDGGDDEQETDSEPDYYKKELQLPDALPLGEFRSVVQQDWRIANLRNTTLQVIVKLANIELTPENQEYAGGSWHVEGMLNERIVSTGIYYYDSENITNSHLAFRCCIHEPEYHGQDDDLCMQWLYDLDRDVELVQTRGQVPTNQGTCLAFPNIYQHCASPFKLADPTKPGHRKILALFLVDPTHPIPSASSVPLQRKDWAMENIHRATLNEDESYLGKLPVEVKQLIIEETDGLMSWEEAVDVRKDLMEERKKFVGTYNGLGLRFLPYSINRGFAHGLEKAK